jgi:nanoRNase/pAp phosphatase (c-di-AMP/oligoRNAs hydrolase)
VSTPQEERSESPSLLLMISDADEIEADARSGNRILRRWAGAAGPPSHTSDPLSDGTFSGDPTAAATYDWVKDARAVSAVIHLRDDEKAQAAVGALRAVRPDCALLVLSEGLSDASGDGTLARAGELRDVLRLDLEDELVRLESERRAWCLRAFAHTHAVVPILIHPDPDPDAISSALAVRALLKRDDISAPIISAGPITRPENRRMAGLLDVKINDIEWNEVEAFDRVIVVDMQPAGIDRARTAFAVIDHHPAECDYCPEFIDVRPEYGAVASMMTEYLRASSDEIDARLATALLYGIRTDTDSLSRHVTPADVDAYAFLQARADQELLRRIERPAMPVSAARAFGTAVRDMVIDDAQVFAFANQLDAKDKHVLADIADFCMRIENVTRAVVAGIVEDQLIITLRDSGGGDGVGTIARELGEMGGENGAGGGHATMARAVLPMNSITQWREGDEIGSVRAMLEEAAARCEAVPT